MTVNNVDTHPTVFTKVPSCLTHWHRQDWPPAGGPRERAQPALSL